MSVATKIRLKNIATLNDEQLSENTDPDHVFEYVDVGSVGRGQLVEQPEKVIFGQAPTRARRRVRSGDTIVSTVRTYLRAILPIGPELNDVIVSTGFAVVRPRPAIESRFLAWYLQSDKFVEEVVARSTGVSYPAIAPSVMGDLELIVPVNRADQARIADFLDRETHRINALIDAKRRMIDLLEEKQESLVHQEVSAEGLANGTRRPSGVGWIGDVPNSWTVTSLRRVTSRIETGGTPPTSESRFYQNGTVPWYGPSSLGSGFEAAEPVKYINQSAVNEGQAKAFPGGSTLVTVIGATLGRSGYLASEGSSNQQITCLVPAKGMHPKYLAWWIKFCAPILVSMAQRTTLPILSNQSLADLPVVLPPLEEQERILKRLERSRRLTDTLKGRLQDQLDLLAEYRQALITQAVTGQLDEGTLKGDKPVDEVVGVIPE